jgi:hypothetical protein
MPSHSDTPPVEARIEALDTTLFDAIPAQMSPDDRRSLLAIQRALALRRNPYRYLEIGSHLGGSIQTHLLDPRCAAIVSIDKRPARQPDERGVLYDYPENSTERMMRNLTSLSAPAVSKITTLDADTGALDPSAIRLQPDLCFIDGEHTDQAVLRDSEFCLAAMAGSGILCIHDSNIVFRGIGRFLERLRSAGRSFHAYNLPACVFVVELGGAGIHDDACVADLLLNNHAGYFAALHGLSGYRDFYNDPLVRRAIRALRKLRLGARLVALADQLDEGGHT